MKGSQELYAIEIEFKQGNDTDIEKLNKKFGRYALKESEAISFKELFEIDLESEQDADADLEKLNKELVRDLKESYVEVGT